MQVSPLVGTKSLRALNAFSALLLGLKMLPAYQMWDYESFYASFKEKTEAEKETLLREATVFVELKPEEVEAMVSFVKDQNGIPYSPANLKNLGLREIHEIIVAVGMEIGRINIDLVTPEEKKSSETSV